VKINKKQSRGQLPFIDHGGVLRYCTTILLQQTMNYHIGVAHNGRKHITLANIHSSNGLYHANYNSEYYKQNPMSMMHCLSFNATRNIRHA
jgi:hypothetical protein